MAVRMTAIPYWRQKEEAKSYVAPAPSATDLEEPASHLEEEIRRQRKRERDENWEIRQQHPIDR